MVNVEEYMAFGLYKARRQKTNQSKSHLVLFRLARLKRSACISLSFRELPFPALASQHRGRPGPPCSGLQATLTILNVLSSSLICCASIGVSRLHVATSPRRSYSWLGHVS